MADQSTSPAGGGLSDMDPNVRFAMVKACEAVPNSAIVRTVVLGELGQFCEAFARALLAASPDIEELSARELHLGWTRYEKARKLSPLKWGELHRRNLTGEKFDAMIDALPDVPRGLRLEGGK